MLLRLPLYSTIVRILHALIHTSSSTSAHPHQLIHRALIHRAFILCALIWCVCVCMTLV